jgi:hypothetical protein
MHIFPLTYSKEPATSLHLAYQHCKLHVALRIEKRQHNSSEHPLFSLATSATFVVVRKRARLRHTYFQRTSLSTSVTLCLYFKQILTPTPFPPKMDLSNDSQASCGLGLPAEDPATLFPLSTPPISSTSKVRIKNPFPDFWLPIK